MHETTKSGKKEKAKKAKMDRASAQKYRKTVQRIRGFSPEEEIEGYGRKISRKRKLYAWNERERGLWMMRMVSLWNRRKKCHS